MTPLGSIFKSGASKPPKIDQHSLFTSIQVSDAVLQGTLQVYEPWKRKRSRPKECHVTLYVNETSPFLVWHKIEKGKNAENGSNSPTIESGLESPTSSTPRPRCVLSVSKAKLRKTAGGSFELTEFVSSLTFRFVANTIQEADSWVEKLSAESMRESKLDMRSICSSRSSFSSSTSSFSSHPSPDASPNEGSRFFPGPVVDSQKTKSRHRKSASFSDSTGAVVHLLNSDGVPGRLVSQRAVQDTDSGDAAQLNLFGVKSTADHIAACKLGHSRSNSKTFPRVQTSRNATAIRQQQHIRAQPHLGVHIAMDKHRPELRNAIGSIPVNKLPSPGDQVDHSHSTLPFSEFFVNVPNT